MTRHRARTEDLLHDSRHSPPDLPDGADDGTPSSQPHARPYDVMLQPWSKATSAWLSPPNRPLVLDVMSLSWRPEAPPTAPRDPD
jgi:hypothetical protein